MNLHENKTLFLDLIHTVSDTLDLDEVYVEKDYWITRSLQRIEKLASLFRFSFSSDPRVALASKIRHFYDLYYLAKDEECAAYVQTSDFKREFVELLTHDQKIFDTPENWKEKKMSQSSLVADFPALWTFLRIVYSSELPKLAFAAVPDEREVAKTFVRIVEQLNS
ncbi:MAG: hypothetical protein LBD35_07850 [Prevotellaceae bacterium]|jgi:hypothetical protein|nr:hypothetical protein [Prevotellaceae bacterium]